MHALTVDRIFTDAELAKRFYTIFQEYQSAYPYDIRYEGDHGFEEFIANIWSDPLTISNLRKVKSPRKAKWSLWQEIRSFLYDVFY
jgi:hypothetical protein